MSTDTPVTAGSEAVFFSVLMLYMEYGNIATVHFVHSNVLDGLWINTSIEKIGNVSVPQLMRGYIKVQRISDFGLIFLGHAQRWGNRVFDALYTMPASPIDKVYPRPEIHNPIAACL